MNPNAPLPGQQPNVPVQPQPGQLPNNGFPPSHNPYDFITNPGSPPRKPLLGGSFKSRLAVIGGGGILLVILLVTVFSLLRGGGGNTAALQTVLADQQEIIRIATIGTTGARSTEGMNLVMNINQAVTSDKVALMAYLKEKKVKTSAEQLAAKKNTATDETLKTASQNNRFDEAFATTMDGLLKTYRSDLSKAYDNASNQESKDILKRSFDSTGLLLDSIAKSAAN
jgi:hypothetical protein